MLSNFYTYIFFYIVIIFSTLGYGMAVCSLGNKFKISHNLGYVGLIGIFFLILYSYISSIFIKHGIVHNSIVITFGLIFFIFFNFIFNKQEEKKEWFHFFLIFSILLVGAFIYKTHDDFPYYHFEYSYYLTQNSLLIGIGQFNLGFRTPSSIFYLNSLFYLPIVKYFMFQMSAILIMGFSNLILLIKLKKNIDEHKINFITYFTLLVFIFINIFFYRIAEHGTDKSAQILVFILFIEIFLLTNFKINEKNQISRIYILIGLIISLKAFYVIYGVFFLAVLIYLLKIFNIKETLKTLIFNYYFIFFTILFLVILLTNFTNSGCLIYPVNLTCFDNIIWSIKSSEVAILNDWYEQWAKAGAGPNYRVENPDHYIQYFNWVSNWIDLYFFNKVSDFLFGILLILIIIYFSFRSKLKKKIYKKKITLVIILFFILLFEWFYNHPALRYGGYCLIASILFIFMSIFLENFSISIENIKKRIIFFVSLALLIFISRNINRISYEHKTYNYEPIRKVYYKIEPNYFEVQNEFNDLIDNYNNCQLNENSCENESNYQVKKIRGKYIFYINE